MSVNVVVTDEDTGEPTGETVSPMVSIQLRGHTTVLEGSNDDMVQSELHAVIPLQCLLLFSADLLSAGAGIQQVMAKLAAGNDDT